MTNTDSGRCPATGRSASACTDPVNHAECWPAKVPAAKVPDTRRPGKLRTRRAR